MAKTVVCMTYSVSGKVPSSFGKAKLKFDGRKCAVHIQMDQDWTQSKQRLKFKQFRLTSKRETKKTQRPKLYDIY